jgi:transposase
VRGTAREGALGHGNVLPRHYRTSCAHGSGGADELRRKEVLAFFAKLAPCLVGMEALGGAHYWAREIAKLGHTVKLMPPKYVKPHVKRGKTDPGDAAAN